MATIDNIIMMLEKGYSKDEIDNLLAQDETDVPEDSQKDAKESQESAKDSQEGAKDSQESAKDSPEESPADDPLQLLSKQVLELTKQVNTMTAAAQLTNVKMAEQPAGGNNEMSPEEFLIRSVYPDYKKED